MAGTREGGLKAAQKNRQWNPDFYHIIGTAGGKKSKGGGLFQKDHEFARMAGTKGGKIGGKVPRRKTERNCLTCGISFQTIKGHYCSVKCFPSVIKKRLDKVNT